MVALPWLLWAVIRVFGLERGHPLTGAIAFTPYVAATAWIPLMLALLLRQRAVAVLALAAFVALAAAVAPRALHGPDVAVAGGRPLTLMTSNMYWGRGDARTIMDLARRNHVEVLSLQERHAGRDRTTRRAGRPDDVPAPRPGRAGGHLGHRHPVRAPARGPPRRALPALPMPQGTLEAPGLPPIQVTDVHPPPPLHGDVAVWRNGLRSFPRRPTACSGSSPATSTPR